MATTTQQLPPRRNDYQARDFRSLIGTRGFSEELLTTHFGLYEGYVKHTNKALQLLREPAIDAYAAAEIRRRLVWEFNGMRLHEFYFEAMANGGKEAATDGALQAAVKADFGSFESWKARFESVGAMRGIGWAVLCYDPVGDNLIHDWVNEHDRGLFAGTQPILVLDLFEHAYMRDYNTDRKGYMKAWWDAVDWTVCEARYRHAKRMAAGRQGA